MEKKVSNLEREKKEEHLRDLAQKARDSRVGNKTAPMEEEGLEAQEREKLRYDRHKERERQRRLTKAHPDKRSMLDREKDRDISEKIALGMPSKSSTQESMFDQRLFNKTKGLDSGFSGGTDDLYNVYDKPWRAGAGLAEKVYRPSKTMDKDVYGDDVEKLIKTSRFQPDKAFSGADGGHVRDGPVQFEKDVDEDPFGLNKFLMEAKKAKRPSEDSMESSRSKRAKY